MTTSKLTVHFQNIFPQENVWRAASEGRVISLQVCENSLSVFRILQCISLFSIELENLHHFLIIEPHIKLYYVALTHDAKKIIDVLIHISYWRFTCSFNIFKHCFRRICFSYKNSVSMKLITHRRNQWAQRLFSYTKHLQNFHI